MDSKKKDTIYIEFKTLFDEAKKRSELKSRSMADQIMQRFIITDSEKDTLRLFYQDAVSDIAERLGVLDRMQDYGGTTLYKLTVEQSEQKMKRTATLLKKMFVNYLLFQWYKSVGQSDLAGEYLQFYDEYYDTLGRGRVYEKATWD